MLDHHGRRPLEAEAIDRQEMERRQAHRHLAVFRVGKLISAGKQDLCLIRNISAGGLMANVFRAYQCGDEVSVELKTGHIVHGRIAWIKEKQVGIAFDVPIEVFKILGAEAAQTPGASAPRAPRVEVKCSAMIRIGANYRTVEILDISQGGAKIAVSGFAKPDDEIVLTVEGLPPWPGTVRWVNEDCLGMCFRTIVPLDMLARWTATHC